MLCRPVFVNTPARLYQQQGVAIIMVLWMIMVLMTMAGSLVFASRAQLQMLDFARFSAQGRALAETAAHFAVMQLFVPAEDRLIKIGGAVSQWNYDHADIEIRLVGENGLVDINRADRGLLLEVLKQAQVPENEHEALLDAIEDFRDTDDLKRIHGAEDKDYEEKGFEAGAKDAPFERMEELQQVMGMTPTLYASLARYLTAHSSARGINPMMAPRHVLLMLAKGDDAVVDTYISEREAAKGGWVQPTFGGEYWDQMGAPVYRMQVSVRMQDDERLPYVEERSIRLLPGRNPPFITYYAKTVSPDARFE